MHNRRVATRGIILNKGKLLCVRLKKYPGRATDDGQDYWCTPGGGVDIGEPLIPALERELIEETGVKPIVGNLLYIQQFEHKDWEHLEFFFYISNGEDYANINLDETTHGTKEIAEVNFVDASTSNILPIFLTKQDIVADANQGLTEVFNNLLP
jgi:8-oxo-dGTP diphosphatase